MDARSGNFFEQQLDSYRTRLGNVKAEQALNWAKKVAESDNPVEALRTAVAEIGTPLALDFLREGIMHYAGVASAQIKNKLSGLDPKLQEIFKGRMDELARVAKMKPAERKKWIADEAKKRRQARLAREAESQDPGAPDSNKAESARAGAGGDREDDPGKPRPATEGSVGATGQADRDADQGQEDRADATAEGARATNEREPDRPAPRVTQENVDDQGISGQIDRLRGLAPEEAVAEYGKIRGNIDSKASSLSRRRRDAMNKGTPDFGDAQSVEDMATELNARNRIVNDALARKGKKTTMATEYDINGDATKIQGAKVKQGTPKSAQQEQEDAQQRAVDDQARNRELRGEPELDEPTLVDAFTGEPVTPKPLEPIPEAPDEEPEDIPDELETQGGAKPPPEPLSARLPPAPPSIANGESYVAQTEVNPFSLVQATEQASRANLGNVFKDGVDPNAPTPDLTGASARPVEPRADLIGRVDPTLPDIPGFTTPSVQQRAQALSQQLKPAEVLPQTATRSGLGTVPGLALERPPKATVAPVRPGGLQTADIGSEPRESAPLISEETGSRIGSGLGALTAVGGVLSPLANPNLTAQQKASAVGEGAGVLTGAEVAQRGARALGASEGLAEGAGFVPGLIATFAGQGSLADKAKSAGQQIGIGAGQKVAQKGVQALVQPKPPASGAGDAVEGATEGLEGAGEGLEGLEAGLAGAGAETGGLGFVLAGLVGIGSALASIFAPHAKAPPAPKPVLPNLSVPVAQQGLN